MGRPEIVAYTANRDLVFSETGPKIPMCPFAAHICDLRASKFPTSKGSRLLPFTLSTWKPEPEAQQKRARLSQPS